MPVIVLNGDSGSGKSTLGLRLNKVSGVVVVETDDIDDAIALKLLKGKTDKDIPKFKKERASQYKKVITNLIDKYSTSKKTLILVGISHCGESVYKNLDNKYCIDIAPEVNFQQLNTRTLHDLCSNKQAILNTLSNTNNMEIVSRILSNKYKIRTEFPLNYNVYIKHYEKKRKERKKLGYKYMSAEDIYVDIVKNIKSQKTGKK
jgi:ABC-type oligopeptide transport system ATPase subunit